MRYKSDLNSNAIEIKRLKQKLKQYQKLREIEDDFV